MSDGHVFSLFGAELTARASGVLWWAHRRILCVSDLHLGKSDRLVRRSGIMVPPYETADTLLRLQSEIEALAPQIVICLGDSFDDLQASDSLDPAESACLYRMQAGRQWIWIEGIMIRARWNFPALTWLNIAMAPLCFVILPKRRLRSRGITIQKPLCLWVGGGSRAPVFCTISIG